jgi:hypothetical protein
MDRGAGMFAGLNVLPKTAWFSSYSSGVTRDMNIAFLKRMNEVWDAAGLLSDTANLDFTAIPYWGDDDPFENNITNDFSVSAGDIIRKYARRWLVEKEISEQIEFFHLNRNSSGIVIKVDFDLTMTILAHNLYRLLAAKFDGYAHCGAKTVFDKFVRNAGEVAVNDNTVTVALKKKRTLPLVLESFPDSGEAYPHLGFRKLSFKAANFT